MAFNRSISLLLLLLPLYCDVTSAQGLTKVWTMNTDKFINFGKDDVDCVDQTYIYQKTGGIVFTAPQRVNTIILPSNGVIMFPQNEEIKFLPRKDQCHGDSYNTNHFKLHTVQPMSWFNADNWQIKGANAHQNKAIPHIDRIPCECDDVEFPANQSLWIDLDYMSELTVKQVRINGRTDNLNDFLETQLGQSMFMFDLSADTFKEGRCENTKSCGCHDPFMFKKYLDTVCLHSEVCHDPNCADPIQPIGHCCPICGAAIQMDVTSAYCMSDLKSVNEFLELETMMHDEFAGNAEVCVLHGRWLM